MNIECSAQALSHAIGAVRKMCGKEPPYSAVRVDALADKIVVTGSDYADTASVEISATVHAPGSHGVPLRALDAALSRAGDTVAISIDDAGRARIDGIVRSAVFGREDYVTRSDDFVEPVRIDDAPQRIKRVMHCANTDETRPVISGVGYSPTTGALAATDGHRASWIGNLAPQSDRSILLPMSLCGMITRMGGSVEISTSAGGIRATDGEIEVCVSRVADVSRHPVTAEFLSNFDSPEMGEIPIKEATALIQSAVRCASRQMSSVFLEIDGCSLIVSALDEQTGLEFRDAIHVDAPDMPRVRCNAAYFTEALAFAGGETAHVGWSGTLTPIRIVQGDAGAIVMPQRG